MSTDKYQRSVSRSNFLSRDLDALARALKREPSVTTPAPLMVTSVGRSGSTLLMRWLAAHPEIAADRTYPLESTVARESFKAVTTTLAAPCDKDMNIVADCARNAAASNARHYVALHHRQEGQGTPRYYAEKNLSPEWLVRLICPEAKEIFLVRDPRDMICSSLAFNAKRGFQAFGRQDVSTDLEYVAHRAAMARPWVVTAWKERSDDALLVHYEQMLKAPHDTLANILRFLGLDDARREINRIIEHVGEDAGLRDRHVTASDPTTSIGRWRTDLSPELITACEREFADYLETFGYPNAASSRSQTLTADEADHDLPLHVLFVLDPYFDLNDPGIMSGWLHWFERLDAALSDACPRYAGALLGFDASVPASVTGFSGGLHRLDQNALRLRGRIGSIPRYALDRLPDDDPLLDALIEHVRSRCTEFEPNLLLLLGESRWLRRAFPHAAHLNIEVSWLFRAPYPAFWSLDPCGWGKGRILEEQPNLLEKHSLSHDDEVAIERFASAARAATKKHGAAEQWVAELRKCAPRIVLLPLAERFALDGRTPVFAALEPLFAERDDRSTAYILTEHPLDRALTLREREYLERYEGVVFPPDTEHIDTQHLIPWVDAVIADFSSVSLQALFFNVEIISIAHRLAYPDALFAHRNPLARISAACPYERRSTLLHWLLAYYSVDEGRLFDGCWLAGRFHSAVACRIDPAAQFRSPILTNLELAEHPWVLQTTEERDIPTAPSLEEDAAEFDRKAYSRAEALIAADKADEARTILVTLCENGTTLWEPYNDLASLLLEHGDTKHCLIMLQNAILHESPPGLAHRNLAAVQLAFGQTADAIATLGTVVRHCPNDLEALSKLREAINQADALDPVTWARLVTNLRAGMNVSDLLPPTL